jgi:hypothetical protein
MEMWMVQAHLGNWHLKTARQLARRGGVPHVQSRTLVPDEIAFLFGVALEALEKIESSWDADAALVHGIATRLDPIPRRYVPGPERLNGLNLENAAVASARLRDSRAGAEQRFFRAPAGDQVVARLLLSCLAEMCCERANFFEEVRVCRGNQHSSSGDPLFKRLPLSLGEIRPDGHG